MPDNNKAYNVEIELPDGVDSMARFSGADGSLLPQRLSLHELIIQAVTERKFLPENSTKYEEHLKAQITDARNLSSYKAIEQSGDYNPQSISAVLDELGLERLPLHERAEQVMMITGGPATGKSSIVGSLAEQKPEVYRNAAQINPDHYKNLLAPFDEWKEKHGTYTHEESSLIAKKIMARLDDRMAAGLPAPHVLMDVVSPNPERMAFSQRFGQMSVATGTAPPEVTLQRAYDRGHNSDDSVRGRVIPSSEVLSGAAKASERMPMAFEHPNLEFAMVNTAPDGKPLPVASWDNNTRRLSVQDPDAFMDFVERQNINPTAKTREEIYLDIDHSPEALAENLKPYTDQGIQIDLLNPDGEVAVTISNDKVEVVHALESNRGSGFFADLAEHFGTLGKNGGVVAGVALGTLSGVFTLAAGGSKSQAAEAVYESAVPYGETQLDLAAGDTDAAARSATIETASNVGSVSGTVAGAAAGAALGSIIPIAGTVVGGIVGGILGSIGGGMAASEAAEYFVDRPAAEIDMQTAYTNLPDTVTPEMSPEVSALVEVKSIRPLFEKQFEELREQGSLPEVAAYIAANPIEHAAEVAFTQDITSSPNVIQAAGLRL